jgi:ribose 5-phosphate isomerase B
MRVAVAFDHRGVKLRERVLEEVVRAGHEPVDLGVDAPEPLVDYPDKAREIGAAIHEGDAERSVLVCGSGVGASVAASKLDVSGAPSATTRIRRTRASSTTT